MSPTIQETLKVHIHVDIPQTIKKGQVSPVTLLVPLHVHLLQVHNQVHGSILSIKMVLDSISTKLTILESVLYLTTVMVMVFKVRPTFYTNQTFTAFGLTQLLLEQGSYSGNTYRHEYSVDTSATQYSWTYTYCI